MNFQQQGVNFQQGKNTGPGQVRHEPVPKIHPERERAYRMLEDSIAHHRSITTALIGHLFPAPTLSGTPIDTGTIAQTAFGYAAEDRSEAVTSEIMSDEDAPYFVPESFDPRGPNRMTPFAVIEDQLVKFCHISEGVDKEKYISKIQIDASGFPLPMLNFMVASIPKCDWLAFCLKLCNGHVNYGMDYGLTPDQRDMINLKLISAIEARFAAPAPIVTPPPVPAEPSGGEVGHVKDTFVPNQPIPNRYPFNF